MVFFAVVIFGTLITVAICFVAEAIEALRGTIERLFELPKELRK